MKRNSPLLEAIKHSPLSLELVGVEAIFEQLK